jgi:hypothetical protein
MPVQFAMMKAANRNRELIAYFASQRTRLRKAKMVRIGNRESLRANRRYSRGFMTGYKENTEGTAGYPALPSVHPIPNHVVRPDVAFTVTLARPVGSSRI